MLAVQKVLASFSQDDIGRLDAGGLAQRRGGRGPEAGSYDTHDFRRGKFEDRSR